jgi:hypothetical protein
MMMQLGYGNLFALALLALCLGASNAHAASITVEVQGVCADNTTKDGVPDALKRFKHILEKTKFTNFKDCGTQWVKPAAGKKDSTTIQGYCIIVNTVKVDGDKATVGVLFKDRDKITHAPVELTIRKGQPIMFAQLGDKESPCIIVLTLTETK